MPRIRRFASFEEAAQAHAAERKAKGLGASKWPGQWRIEVDGVRYRMSYNSKVWRDEDWTPGAVPVFNPYANDQRACLACDNMVPAGNDSPYCADCAALCHADAVTKPGTFRLRIWSHDKDAAPRFEPARSEAVALHNAGALVSHGNARVDVLATDRNGEYLMGTQVGGRADHA